jgi:hypothetical protein
MQVLSLTARAQQELTKPKTRKKGRTDQATTHAEIAMNHLQQVNY